MTMRNTNTYTSPIITIIGDWLAQMSPTQKAASQKESVIAVNEAVSLLGYGAPFDKEQRTINKMLIEKSAGKVACIVAWGFYHDYKVVEATRKAA
ncbi:hypothetical protein N9W89_14300 [Hellea sp.]|nr:hypothetical protein [Hellea sp.]